MAVQDDREATAMAVYRFEGRESEFGGPNGTNQRAMLRIIVLETELGMDSDAKIPFLG